jgi:hypothetical protein
MAGSWIVRAVDAHSLVQKCLAAIEAVGKAPNVLYVAELRVKVPEFVQMETALKEVLGVEYADVRTREAMLGAVQQVVTMVYLEAGNPPNRDLV